MRVVVLYSWAIGVVKNRAAANLHYWAVKLSSTLSALHRAVVRVATIFLFVVVVCIIIIVGEIVDVVRRQTLDAGESTVVKAYFVETEATRISADGAPVDRLYSIAACRVALRTHQPQVMAHFGR